MSIWLVLTLFTSLAFFWGFPTKSRNFIPENVQKQKHPQNELPAVAATERHDMDSQRPSIVRHLHQLHYITENTHTQFR